MGTVTGVAIGTSSSLRFTECIVIRYQRLNICSEPHEMMKFNLNPPSFVKIFLGRALEKPSRSPDYTDFKNDYRDSSLLSICF
jgi:hypothetical protein